MELYKLQVLQGQSGANNHGIPITRARVRTRAAEVGSPISASSHDGLVRTETVESAVFHVEGNDTNTLTILP